MIRDVIMNNYLRFATLVVLVTSIACLPTNRRQINSASIDSSTPCSLSFFRYLYNLPGEQIRPPVPAGTVMFNKVVPPEEGNNVGSSSQLQPSYQPPTTFNQSPPSPIQPQASYPQPSYRPPPVEHSEGSRIDAPEQIKPESSNDNKVGYLPPPPDNGYLPPPSDTNKLGEGEEGSSISPVSASPSSEYPYRLPALESKYNPTYSAPQHDHNGAKCTCDEVVSKAAYPAAGSESRFSPSVVSPAVENRIDYTFSTPAAPTFSLFTGPTSTRFANGPKLSSYVPQFNAISQGSTIFRPLTSSNPFPTSNTAPLSTSTPSYPSAAASQQVGYNYLKPNVPFPSPQISSNRFVSENDQNNDNNLIVLKV